jgi:hypothetical protein
MVRHHTRPLRRVKVHRIPILARLLPRARQRVPVLPEHVPRDALRVQRGALPRVLDGAIVAPAVLFE